ncbi:MAG: rhomboid family intramembrane serine protease [Gemmataceae bacterium]|nr:rhomboid family intramembrane serine protease [Gemmataceae bacterium]
MTNPNASPLVAVLLRVAYHAPKPWFFREGLEKTAQNEQIISDTVDLLEQLHAEGLIEKVAAVTAAQGPGVVLTAKGRQVAMDPDAKRKLAEGAALDSAAGSQIRASVRGNLTPWLTRGLVLAKVAVFCLGWWAAWRVGFAERYFMGAPRDFLEQQRYLAAFRALGGLAADDLLEGAWWRMVATAFVSAGVLPLLLGLWFMWGIGAFVERVYGRWRMALIYLVAVWCGSCLAMARAPAMPAIGGAGGSDGLFAAMGVWVLLAGRHLPSQMASGLRGSLIVNVVILVVIAFLPGMPIWAMVGGAIGGGLAGMALHLTRFGPAWGRVLGVAAALGVGVAGWAYLDSERQTSKEWARIEGPVFVRDIGARVRDDSDAAQKAYGPMDDLFGMHLTRRDGKKVAEAIEGMKGPLERLEALAGRLRRPWPYRSKAARDAAKVAADYVADRAAYYREAARALEAGERWTKAEDKAHGEMWEKVKKGRKEWADEVRSLQEKRPKEEG